MDVQTALLKVDVEKEVFVKMSPVYERKNKAEILLVMKLKRSLYGLHQSPKNWFGTMDQCLGNIGFFPLKSSPCEYIYEDEASFMFRCFTLTTSLFWVLTSYYSTSLMGS